MPGLQTSGQAYQAATVYYYNPGALPPKPDDWYSYVARADYLQTTEFVNLTFDVTKRLHVEAGTVHFHSSFNTQSYGGFWYAPQSSSTAPGSSHKWDSKLGLSFNATDTTLVYADASQGFRDGGINPGLPEQCVEKGIPLQFKPDTLTNYELGLKTALLDKRLTWDSAVYYMPWKNLQTVLFDPGYCPSSSFNANVGDARIYGAESTIKYRPNSRLSMEYSASYNDSRVSSSIPGLNVDPGERLPYVPYFSWSGNIRYEKPLQSALRGFVQYDVAHKGDMWNELQANGSNGLPRELQPGYTIMNVRLGVNQTDEHWTGEFYITNLTNKSAVIYTNEGNFDLRQTVNEPRVFGVRLSYRFGKQSFNDQD
jgi:outer membrane receptor protein involved in Fe transport